MDGGEQVVLVPADEESEEERDGDGRRHEHPEHEDVLDHRPWRGAPVTAGCGERPRFEFKIRATSRMSKRWKTLTCVRRKRKTPSTNQHKTTL